jgi:hypothetical protein
MICFPPASLPLTTLLTLDPASLSMAMSTGYQNMAMAVVSKMFSWQQVRRMVSVAIIANCHVLIPSLRCIAFIMPGALV